VLVVILAVLAIVDSLMNSVRHPSGVEHRRRPVLWTAVYIVLVVLVAYGAVSKITTETNQQLRNVTAELYPFSSATAGFVVGIEFHDRRLAEYHERLLRYALSPHPKPLPDTDPIDRVRGQLTFGSRSPLMPQGDEPYAKTLFGTTSLTIVAYEHGETQLELNAIWENPLVKGDANRDTYTVLCFLRTPKKECVIDFGPYGPGRRPETINLLDPGFEGLYDLLGDGRLEFRLTTAAIGAPIKLRKVDLFLGETQLVFFRDTLRETAPWIYQSYIPSSMNDLFNMYGHRDHPGLLLPEEHH
jgi:hypothetical protein